jgi:type I restriction enzyme S subunit
LTRSANLADASALFGSTLADAFYSEGEVPTEALGSICRFEGGSQPPKSQFVESPRKGYIRLLQIRDFKSDEKAVYIPDDGKRRRCAEDDIMIGRYGASVGQIHRGKAGTYNVALIKTIPDPDVLVRDYFYYYLLSDLFQKSLLSRSSRGAQDGFNKEDIAPFPVPVPSLEAQQSLVGKLSSIEAEAKRLVTQYKCKLSDIAKLRQSLLQKAFSGELT